MVPLGSAGENPTIMAYKPGTAWKLPGTNFTRKWISQNDFNWFGRNLKVNCAKIFTNYVPNSVHIIYQYLANNSRVYTNTPLFSTIRSKNAPFRLFHL